jgi:hypothetical protein
MHFYTILIALSKYWAVKNPGGLAVFMYLTDDHPKIPWIETTHSSNRDIRSRCFSTFDSP